MRESISVKSNGNILNNRIAPRTTIGDTKVNDYEVVVNPIDPMHVRSKPSQTAVLELVTPERAQELLNNAGDANIRKMGTPDYQRASTMAKNLSRVGGWKHDGSTIKINSAGQMIDGQHRCTWIIKGKLQVWSWVIYGVDEVETIDSNKLRTLKDLLSRVVEKHTPDTAVATKWLEGYTRGVTYANNVTRGTNDGWLDFYNQNRDDIDEAVVKAQDVRHVTKPTAAAIFYFLARRTHAAYAEQFIAMLASGANLEAEHPIKLCRDTLMRNSGLQMISKLAYMIKTWNLWMTGDYVKVLRFAKRATNNAKENFPELIRVEIKSDRWV